MPRARRRSCRPEQERWIFKLREGVKFHDGSEFTADAVVWNFDKLLKNDAPQYDQRQSAQGRSRIPAIASYKAVDKYTLEIITKTPDATLPYQLAWIMMSSPAQWEKLGKSWDAFAKTPSGTGPWKLTLFAPRERAEMVPNKDYWDKARVPKLDKLVLLPLPEANARVAALRAGQVDWIEAPAPDAVDSLKKAGFNIVINAYPHNWTWHLSRAPGSPWNDIRVRKAANLAIDRDGMKELLRGLMIPAEGFMPPGHQWFGKPTFKVKYDPAEAKKLLAEAGYSTSKPLVMKALISASGSGQMQPLPMNEFVQQNLAEVGIKVEFEVVDWNPLINIWRAGATDPALEGRPRASTSPTSCRTRSPASSATCNATWRRRRAPTGATIAIRRWTSCSTRCRPPSIPRSRPRCCRRSTRNTWTTRCS